MILQGARQVGKTFLLKEFGREEYTQVAYINFEENEDIHDVFKGNIDPDRILKYLSAHLKLVIDPAKALIIFDEIQKCPRALNSLKYFCEKKPEYHLCAAGSLLGVAINQELSFPVGKVNFLELFPVNFLEFISALGFTQLRELVENREELTNLPESFHHELIEKLKQYYFVGGMPEAVMKFVEAADWERVRRVQNEILDAYLLDFAKYAEPATVVKIQKLWSQIPTQLAKENHRFYMSGISGSARLRDYQEALQWLVSAGLVHKVERISRPGLPLSGYAEDTIFKLYFFDTGLLSAFFRLSSEIFLKGDELFTHYYGALVENFVSQELKAYLKETLYFWSSKGEAEVDFVYQDSKRGVVPVEVKAGLKTRSHSLTEYIKKYSPEFSLRTSLRPFGKRNHAEEIPLYALNILRHNLSNP
ncbi:MAG: ATP-binding protein [Deltaproteobacteria bacterium]|nr:MAG: ATP-binding protein [Deltaproteobacteria bacterium]